MMLLDLEYAKVLRYIKMSEGFWECLGLLVYNVTSSARHPARWKLKSYVADSLRGAPTSVEW